MPRHLVMPKLSDSNEESVIVKWLKHTGEAFTRGEPLAEIETDKATVVYEAESDGVIASIVVEEGGTARPGDPIATIDGDGEARTGAPAAAEPVEPAAPAGVGRRIDFRAAVREALDEALAADERVVLFGEDVAVAGGVFAVTPGLYEKHGPERVFDTPISELALAGAAFGSAVTGLRPVVEIMFGDFLPLVMDSVVNQMSKYWFLTGGQVSVPVVIRSVVGGGGRFGAIHSQVPASWFMGVPGIKIVAPAMPADARALLRAAIEDDNPVLFFEHKRLYGVEGAADGASPVIGEAAVVRDGRDVTLVSAMRGVHECLAAAEALSARGIEAEVVDLRTLRPLDRTTVLASLERTNRLVVVEEGPLTGGWAGEVLALAAEHGLGDIDDAWRIATPDSPIPYSPPLEDAHLPGAARIASEVEGRLR
jgi:acetoin:2,6-dichlorophenolindophenol oxidoreductase subunit beta